MNCWNEYPVRVPSSRAWAAHVNRAQLLKPIIGFTPIAVLVLAATLSATAGEADRADPATVSTAALASAISLRCGFMGLHSQDCSLMIQTVRYEQLSTVRCIIRLP